MATPIKHDTSDEQATSKHAPPASVQPTPPSEEKKQESTQAGPNHSEQRDLLEQNITRGQGERHQDLPAGQHATGSFTGENDRLKK